MSFPLQTESRQISPDAQKLAVTADNFVYITVQDRFSTEIFQATMSLSHFRLTQKKLLLLGQVKSALADLSSGKLAPLPKFGSPTGNFRGGRLVAATFKSTAEYYETKALFDVATAELVNVVTLEKLRKTQTKCSLRIDSHVCFGE
ncbi:MAG: hypothetical protein U0936_25815 [Planctomycetaceae bacterium]